MSQQAMEEAVHRGHAGRWCLMNEACEEAHQIVGALIAASGGPDHIIHVGDRHDDFTMQHPITERFNMDPRDKAHLFRCNVFQLARIAAAQGAFDRGQRYKVWVERGVLMTEEL